MADFSHIEWTDATWNPVTGCSMVSAGCTNCYAMGLAATRLRDHPSRAGLTRITGGRPVWTGEVRLNEQWLDQPLRWRRPRRIFVCAHGDLFHEAVPDEWIDRVFAVMALAPHHTFQVLTKRPARMAAYLADETSLPERIGQAAHKIDWQKAQEILPCFNPDDMHIFADMPLPNVWLGTSVEDQATADARIPHLLSAPAAVRFLSCEPLLGPVDLRHLRRYNPRGEPWIDAMRGLVTRGQYLARSPSECSFATSTRCIPPELPSLDWVIVGGESGPGARPMHPDWARSLRDQCVAAGVAFHFKQWGEWMPWEMRTAPMWQAQDSRWQDGNILFPTDMDNDPRWDDGLNLYEPGVTDHCAFERVGKRAAGRLLDGRTWDQFPGTSHD